MENNHYNVGKSIKEVREARGITQDELSQKTGLTINYISRLENGHRGISIDSLNDISKILDFPAPLFYTLNAEDIDGPFKKVVREVRDKSREYLEKFVK